MGFRSRNWAQAASKARGRGEGVALVCKARFRVSFNLRMRVEGWLLLFQNFE